MKPGPYQGIAAVDSPSGGIGYVVYPASELGRYNQDIERGALENGTKILDSRWLDEAVASTAQMGKEVDKFDLSKMKIYQGVAVINDDTEGPCITFYTCAMKGEYNRDVKEGKQPDGRRMINNKWANKPMNFDGIHKVSQRLWKQAF
jgi:hypothetical protein